MATDDQAVRADLVPSRSWLAGKILGRPRPHQSGGPTRRFLARMKKIFAQKIGIDYARVRLWKIKISRVGRSGITGRRQHFLEMRKLFSDYVEIVAEHGFDSAAAWQFKLDHSEHKEFLEKASAHDRMVLQSFRERESR